MESDTTVPAPSRTATAPKFQPLAGMSWRTQRIVLVAGVIVLLILAFYGGRAYQNNIDQKLFTAYNPPTTGTRGAGGFGATGAGTGSGSLVNTALGVGSPPGTSSGNGTGNAGSSSNFGFGGSGAGSGGSGASSRISGTLASISSASLSVTSFSGLSQSIGLEPTTRFYKTESLTVADLKPGMRVTILATGSGNQLTAASISLGPVTSGGGRRFSGAGGVTVAGASVSTLKGTIASVSASSLSLNGRSQTIGLSSTTRITKAASIKASQLATGTFVTVSVASVGGNQVATSVVTRAGGFGGGFGATQPGG